MDKIKYVVRYEALNTEALITVFRDTGPFETKDMAEKAVIALLSNPNAHAPWIIKQVFKDDN